MKNLLVAALLGSLYSVPSFALVRQVESCETANHEYRVIIGDNEGIGPVRTPHYYASLQDTQGNNLVAFNVEIQPGVKSVSFGRTTYIDQETMGQKFSLAFPSTNYHHISLHVTLDNGQVLSDENLACENFNN